MRRFLFAAMLTAAMVGGACRHADARAPRREGFWIGAGLGAGSAGTDCRSCSDDRTTGFSGDFHMGGTVSPRVLLGGETNGWFHSEGGLDEKLGFASMIVVWYPGRTSNFYLKFGLGGMRYVADDGEDELTATAPSALFGLGYEVEATPNFFVVPFLNTLATSSVELKLNGYSLPTREDVSVNLVQFGVGVLWH